MLPVIHARAAIGAAALFRSLFTQRPDFRVLSYSETTMPRKVYHAATPHQVSQQCSTILDFEYFRFCRRRFTIYFNIIVMRQ